MIYIVNYGLTLACIGFDKLYIIVGVLFGYLEMNNPFWLPGNK